MNTIFSPQLTKPDPFIGTHHRRAHSHDPYRIADINPGPRNLLMDDFGSDDDLFHMYLDMEKVGSGCQEEGDPVKKTKHGQSLSVGGFGYGSIEAKKAMAPEKLAELAVVDPKRAKRIIANRQSAARSKERKARYISELERKVQTLQIELATLSAQHSLLQRDITSLAAENNELKLRLQAMEQQAQLHEALNEALKNEVERLKYATGDVQNPSSTCNISLQQIQLNESFHSRTQNQHHHHHQQQQLSFHQPVQQSQQMLSSCHMVDRNHNQNMREISSVTMMPQDQIVLVNELDFNSEPQIVQPESLTASPTDESSN